MRNMVTQQDLVTGGRTSATWFARMLSSRESFQLFFEIPLLAPQARDSLKSKIISTDFEDACSPPFEAHLFSTYLKNRKQVEYNRKWKSR